MKIFKIIIILIIFIGGGIAYYLISPIFNVIEIDEPIYEEPFPSPTPVSTNNNSEPTPQVDIEEVVEKKTQRAVSEEKEIVAPIQNTNNEEEVVEASNEEEVVEVSNEEEKEKEEETEIQNTIAKEYPTVDVVGTSGHSASGTARIVNTADGLVVRFENFKTTNGPRLHVYASKDLEASEFIDLGPIKGTKGNINYAIPDGVSLEEYPYILHWCVPFRVLFNYAKVQ